MSCFILLEFSILYFVSRALWIALICVAGLFFHSIGAYYLSFFCTMWVPHTGAQQGKPMERRINPFSKMDRYVPHTWAVCTGTGKQRAAISVLPLGLESYQRRAACQCGWQGIQTSRSGEFSRTEKGLSGEIGRERRSWREKETM